MNNIHAVILVVIAGTLLVSVAVLGVKTHEIGECERWAVEAEEIEDYYIVGWQEGQCSRYGVKINAEVK